MRVPLQVRNWGNCKEKTSNIKGKKAKGLQKQKEIARLTEDGCITKVIGNSRCEKRKDLDNVERHDGIVKEMLFEIVRELVEFHIRLIGMMKDGPKNELKCHNSGLIISLWIIFCCGFAMKICGTFGGWTIFICYAVVEMEIWPYFMCNMMWVRAMWVFHVAIKSLLANALN